MSTQTPALIGVNAPYLLGDYGHDLAPNGRYPDWPVRFDPMHAYRPIVEAATMGLGAIRVWLCENGEGIVVEDGAITGVHPDLLEAVRIFQEGAALNGLRIYWTLLDGNAVVREADPITRSILTDPAQRERFVDKVVGPISEVADPAVTFAIEVVNEPETATPECFEKAEKKTEGAEPVEWEPIGATLRAASERIGSRHVTTAGTMHVFLKQLWATSPKLGAVDIHVYHQDGGLPSRTDLAKYVDSESMLTLPLIAGECGIPKDPGPTTPLSLCNYVYNADSNDYGAVFLWQLEGELVDSRQPKRPFTKLGWEMQRILGIRST